MVLRNVIYFNKVWTVGSSANRPNAKRHKNNEIHDDIEVFDSMDVDADRRLAFPEFRQGLSLLGMTSAWETQSLGKRQEVIRNVETVKLSGMLASCMETIVSDGKLEKSYSKLTDISCC